MKTATKKLNELTSFATKNSKYGSVNYGESVDLVTFAEEIFNGKLHFLCSASSYFVYIQVRNKIVNYKEVLQNISINHDMAVSPNIQIVNALIPSFAMTNTFI